MDVHDVLTRFPGAKRSGAGWQARCPEHADRTPSLTISEGDDGRTLVHCHAGCPVEDILAAVGLALQDLFVDTGPTSTTSRAIAETYPYTDEQGALLYEVVRYAPKDFRQRRPDGHGGWLWKLTDVRRVLYGLPALLGQRVVYIAEGEKDVGAVCALGLVATTNAGGAGQWRDDYSLQLQAAGVEAVVILPDNDTAGQAHAIAVARSCHAVGLQVKVVALPDLPAKGDVSDYLQTHTMTDLLALVDMAAAFDPEMVTAPSVSTAADAFVLTSMGNFLAEPEEAENWLVDGRITKGSTAIMAAKPKVGKSTTARALALAVARGDPWLGFACAAGMVWYLAFEGRRQDIREHFRQMGARDDDHLRVFVGQAPKDVVLKVRSLAEHERPALIIIDTMQRFLKARSTDDYAEMTTLLDAVIGIAQQSGATVLLLHHSGKATRAGVDAVLGSTAITGSADTILLLANNERCRTIATVQRTGHDLDETVILLDTLTGCVTLGGTRQQADAAAVGSAMLAALQQADGPHTEAEIEKLVEGRTIVKRAALRQLVAREQVSRTGRGGKGDPFRYACVIPVPVFPLKGGNTQTPTLIRVSTD
ncbi:MAG: AAA family ATPase [Acidobacteria bacterium]|nr:AAA family ATPase [Acidobacteriota bacterium]